MAEAVPAAGAPRVSRLDRRKARTRQALIDAAVRLIAEGRGDRASIAEITEEADIGFGSFYNHFDSKEQLFQTSSEEVLERWGQMIDRATAGITDPAELFAVGTRISGRLRGVPGAGVVPGASPPAIAAGAAPGLMPTAAYAPSSFRVSKFRSVWPIAGRDRPAPSPKAPAMTADSCRRTHRYGRLSFTGAGLRGVGIGMRGSGSGGADRVPIRSPLRTLAALIRAR